MIARGFSGSVLDVARRRLRHGARAVALLRYAVHTARHVRRAFAPVRLADATRERVARYPQLERFVHASARALRWPGASIERCAGAFATLAAGDFLREFVEGELRALQADPAHAIMRRTHYRAGFPIVETDCFSLRLVFVSPVADTHPIAGVTRSLIFAAAGTTPITIERFERPRGGRGDVYDPSARLRHAETVTLQPGDSIVLRRGVDAYRMNAAERTAALTFSAGANDELRWRYDPVTLAPVGATPNELAWSRLRETLRLVAEMGDPTFAPRVAGLLRHPSHAVRWAALRTALVIDPPRGLRLLERTARDTHPQLRDAALRLIERRRTDPRALEGAIALWR